MKAIIATRNNPQGLCGLLGSIYASSLRMQIQYDRRIELFISDSSDIPITSHPSLSRMLSAFEVSYVHSQVKDQNHQRLYWLRRVGDDTHVFMLDDDLLLVTDYTDVYDRLIKEETDSALGVTVDLYNDKGFTDYSFYTDSLDDSHGYNRMADISNIAMRTGINLVMSGVDSHLANIGHLFCKAGELREIYEELITASCPSSVIDDAVAVHFSRQHKVQLCRNMLATHVGNANQNWKDHSYKHTAVKHLLLRTFGE